jgi:hypothetical protein
LKGKTMSPATKGSGIECVGRVRTVEYDPGWGWIARNPYTGRAIPDEDFRWRSRSVARSVVLECRLLQPRN